LHFTTTNNIYTLSNWTFILITHLEFTGHFNCWDFKVFWTKYAVYIGNGLQYSWRAYLAEPIRHSNSTVNCVGKVHWFWMFQQVAPCFEAIKWDWTNLAKDRTTFCISIIHYKNFGRRTCNCRKEESVMTVWKTVQQEWQKCTENETNLKQDQ